MTLMVATSKALGSTHEIHLHHIICIPLLYLHGRIKGLTFTSTVICQMVASYRMLKVVIERLE